MSDDKIRAALVTAALVLGAGLAGICCGCRTAGEARTAHHVVIENAWIGGDVYVEGGAGSKDVSQTAGKETGLTGAAAQVSDNTAGFGGSSATREGGGGSPTLDTTGAADWKVPGK